MWDEVRNDPFLRTVAIIIIGVLVFGLLFNTMPGTGAMSMAGEGEHMSRNAGYGYSLGSIIGWLLMMLIRILLIVLIAAVLIGAFIWIRNMFFRDNNSAFARALNNDPMLKTVVLITFSIIGLVILFSLFNSFMTPGYGGAMVQGHMGGGYGYGYNPTFGLNWVLMQLIRVLTYVLIISLIIAFAVYLKNQYDCGKLNWFTAGRTQYCPPKDENQTNPDTMDSTV